MTYEILMDRKDRGGGSKRCRERDAQKSALEETDPRDLEYIYGGLLVRAATTLRKALTDGP